ncbi:uncharacterized protein LOC113470437 [Diaphorina citri]|uniref:Uncharacterized protein LOC113470437 n=1 Tax=Diaphorina citri TaxID=121845 RepID=A0A3Q0JCJ0_DIACI|nr:uncharacterized protein LOC113470437 [Diaphorina citri]
MRMRRLVLAILTIPTTVISLNADQNGQWKGYTNLVSYSYGPPSGQVTPRRQIKIRMATESVKLECFTGQNSIVSNYGCLLFFFLRNYVQTLTFILRADEDRWSGAWSTTVTRLVVMWKKAAPLSPLAV